MRLRSCGCVLCEFSVCLVQVVGPAVNADRRADVRARGRSEPSQGSPHDVHPALQCGSNEEGWRTLFS